MSSERLRIAAAACLLLLGGCGSGLTKKDAGAKTSSVPKNLTKPATGPVIKATTYSFKAPSKWRQRPVPETKNSAAKAEVAVVDSTDSRDDFTDNITITRRPELSEFSDVDALAESAKAGLEVNSIDATGIAVGKPVQLDGEVAATVTATLKNPAGMYDVVQYYVPRAETGYVITFSFSIDKSMVEQNRIAQSVAATWTWADNGSKDTSND